MLRMKKHRLPSIGMADSAGRREEKAELSRGYGIVEGKHRQGKS